MIMEEVCEIKNAIITNARIEIEDRCGTLTVWLNLDYGSCVQSFGGYSLYLPYDFKNNKLNSIAGHFIYRIMEIAGVNKWDELKGKTIRVKSNWVEIFAIGHIIKDDWFTSDEIKSKE